MYFDRCDIVTAYYLFFVHYHEGQWSEKYLRLCRILRYFTPSPLLKYENLTENQLEIYNRLVENYSPV